MKIQSGERYFFVHTYIKEAKLKAVLRSYKIYNRELLKNIFVNDIYLEY
jgi:hypothetical protein